MVDRNCTGPAPKIVVQSRGKWPNQSLPIGGLGCQIKRLDEENGESQTACHLLILKARYVCLFHHKEDYASQDKPGKL